mmetsp:Transcript_20796/g.46419  ORF Transcript_20796/g.46419 Transcript_20796/m.46419 type:complete len:243 (+) Transcript_20796:188-916(+)
MQREAAAHEYQRPRRRPLHQGGIRRLSSSPRWRPISCFHHRPNFHNITIMFLLIVTLLLDDTLTSVHTGVTGGRSPIAWIGISSSILPVAAVAATSIKWTPGASSVNSNPNDDKPNAATAPRSQKYWDEHNIERPDYAKTDGEIASERAAAFKDGLDSTLGTTVGRVAMTLVLGAVVYGYLIHTGRVIAPWDTGSFRLGGGRSSSRTSSEDARKARLARFDNMIDSATHGDNGGSDPVKKED